MRDTEADIANLDLGHTAWSELHDRMQTIADRRGISRGALMREAVQNFLEDDFLTPKGNDTDTKMSFGSDEAREAYLANRPGEYEGEVRIYRHTLTLWPNPDECPDDHLESWLELIKGDLIQIDRCATKEAKVLSDVTKKYQELKTRLMKRLGVRKKS